MVVRTASFEIESSGPPPKFLLTFGNCKHFLMSTDFDRNFSIQIEHSENYKIKLGIFHQFLPKLILQNCNNLLN